MKLIQIVFLLIMALGISTSAFGQQYLSDDEKVALLAPENQSSEVITAALDLDLTLEDIQYANKLKKSGVSDEAIILVMEDRLKLNEKEEAQLKKSKKPAVTLENILRDRKGKGIWLVHLPAAYQWTMLVVFENQNELVPGSGFRVGAGGTYMLTRNFGWKNDISFASYGTRYFSDLTDQELKLSTINITSEFILFSRLPGNPRAFVSAGIETGVLMLDKKSIQTISGTSYDFTDDFGFQLPLNLVGQVGGATPIRHNMEAFSGLRIDFGSRDISSSPQLSAWMFNFVLVGGVNLFLNKK